MHARILLCSCACTIVQRSAILRQSSLLRMRVPQPPTLPLSDREIITLLVLFALPECASLCFRQFLLPPPTPLRILLLQINYYNKVGKGLSYSVTVLSTGPLLHLWVAPRLTAYHTLSPGPRPGFECPFKSVTQDHSYSALTPISQPKLTLLLYCVRSGYFFSFLGISSYGCKSCCL